MLLVLLRNFCFSSGKQNVPEKQLKCPKRKISKICKKIFVYILGKTINCYLGRFCFTNLLPEKDRSAKLETIFYSLYFFVLCLQFIENLSRHTFSRKRT